MKIAYEGGKLTATAETLEDVAVLLALKAPAKVDGRKQGGNRWKGKHKVPCIVCGKSFKNVKRHMAAHKGQPRSLIVQEV